MLSRHYLSHRTIDPEVWPVPQFGARVIYHSKVSGVPLVAMVTCTQATYDPEVGRRGDLEPPTSIMHVHVQVFSTGGSSYGELDIGPGYGPGQWAPLEGAL